MLTDILKKILFYNDVPLIRSCMMSRINKIKSNYKQTILNMLFKYIKCIKAIRLYEVNVLTIDLALI